MTRIPVAVAVAAAVGLVVTVGAAVATGVDVRDTMACPPPCTGVGAGVGAAGGTVAVGVVTVVTFRGTVPNFATGTPAPPGRHIFSTPVSEITSQIFIPSGQSSGPAQKREQIPGALSSPTRLRQ